MISTDRRVSDPARIELPASWQGPVEMEIRWKIPREPTNQIGVEDETGDVELVDLPTSLGTTKRTHIPLKLPTIPKTRSFGQPIKLEVAGRIGGRNYEDEFAVPLKYLDSIEA